MVVLQWQKKKESKSEKVAIKEIGNLDKKK